MRAVIVHRNQATGRGLALILEKYGNFEIMAEASNLDEAPDVALEQRPDLVVIDSEFPEPDLEKTIGFIKESLPETSVAVLTGSDDWAHLQASIRAGAASFVSMDTDPENLALSLRLASDGHVLVSSSLVSDLSDIVADEPAASDDGVAHDLSVRELEILGHVVNGATNQEIAGALSIAENTVKVHMRNILGKLQLHNRQQAAAYALKTGIISDAEFRADNRYYPNHA